MHFSGVISAVSVAICLAASASGQLTVAGFQGSQLAMDSAGAWSIATSSPAWNFAGRLETRPWNLAAGAGQDALGSFQQISFNYSPNGGARAASIRLYDARALAIFSLNYLAASANTNPFPVISTWPQLSHLTFFGEFASPQFTHQTADSPWAFFDPAGNTYIVSPAMNYLFAATNKDAKQQIVTGIDPAIPSLPGGFAHATALAWGHGINQTFQNWGNALTDLTGKHRPPNDLDALLDTLSYWTDNGATYYYNPGDSSYTSTLMGARAELEAKGIRLGALQLDSWWYPKGPDNSWSSHGGLWDFVAAPDLFRPDLKTFAANLGVPLVAHSRWIDVNSPLRSKYTMSGGVSTDPAYWRDIAAYLKSNGVATFEQDWLGDAAHPNYNLTDPNLFFDGMAAAMDAQGITMQYCMALPKHFLQSVNYSNLTTARTSQDGFGPARWNDFLYASMFASALGIWPFSDVAMSTNRADMMLATLSAGPVGIGDALGNIAGGNVLRAVRPDGVIVKPDVPITPTDDTIIADALGVDVPMVAATYTDLGNGVRGIYFFAYARGANTSFTVNPSAYGINGAAWLYRNAAGAGQLIQPNATVTVDVTTTAELFVLMPVGKAGIAFLGDKGHFVSLGRKRISDFIDAARLEVEIQFTPGEKERTVFGYSPKPVAVMSVAGGHGSLSWDSTTQLFSVIVRPGKEGAARIRMIHSFAPGGVNRTAN